MKNILKKIRNFIVYLIKGVVYEYNDEKQVIYKKNPMETNIGSIQKGQ